MLSNIALASDEVKDRNDGFDFFTVYIEVRIFVCSKVKIKQLFL